MECRHELMTMVESVKIRLYQELSRLQKSDVGALEKAEKKNQRYEAIIKEKDDKIKQLTDQLAWFWRKFWKPSSERYMPQDPNQRRIDFDGLEVRSATP